MRGSVPRELVAVILAASASFFAISSPQARPSLPGCGAEYQASFARVLRRPADAAINMDFAARAEACGDLGQAYAALERAVVSNPGNVEAQMQFVRVRNLLTPAATSVTVEVGANYASNPLTVAQTNTRLRYSFDNFSVGTGTGGSQFTPDGPQSQSFGLAHSGDATFSGNVSVSDERTIAGVRWRTALLAQSQVEDQVSKLNTAIVSAESGPLLNLGAQLWLYIAGGGAATWLDDLKLYDDTTASATVGSVLFGQTQTLTVRYTWRNGNFVDAGTNGARLIDVEARLAFSPSLVRGDVVNLAPRVEVSEAQGPRTVPATRVVFDNPDGNTDPSQIVPTTDPLAGYQVVRPLSQGDYTEVGGRIAYSFPLFKGAVFFGAGFGYYHRWYDEYATAGAFLGPTDIFDQPLSPPPKRHDTYIEPTANVVLPNFLGPNVDVRFDYRYERRLTNASTTSNGTISNQTQGGLTYDWDVTDTPLNYDNHVAGVHVVGSF